MKITMPVRASFDVEKRTAGDDPYLLEVTCLAVIVSDQPDRIHLWDYGEIDKGVEFLLACPGLVSFNGKGFDIPTLLKYVDRPHGRKLRSLPHYDIYDEFIRKERRRMSLKNMAKYSLGIDKWDLQTMSPMALWRIDPAKLAKYCVRDTYLTSLLYTHTISFGHLLYKAPTLRQFVPETISRRGLT